MMGLIVGSLATGLHGLIDGSVNEIRVNLWLQMQDGKAPDYGADSHKAIIPR